MDNENQQIADMVAEGGTDTTQINTPPPPPAAPDYAKMYADAQAQMAIQSQQINQLIQSQQQVLQQVQQRSAPNTPPAPNVFEKFDPDTAKALQGVTEHITSTFKAELAVRDRQLAELRATAAIQQVAPNLPPEITKQAQELYTNLQQKGIPVNVQETVDMLVGQAIRNGTYNPATTQKQRVAPAVLNGGSVSRQTTRPANFDRLPPSEQNKYIEASGELDAEF